MRDRRSEGLLKSYQGSVKLGYRRRASHRPEKVMRMSEQETPWSPGPHDTPFAFTLVNPNGTGHLAFDQESGVWHRIWQHRAPQPLHTGAAVLLRPSDIGTIIKISMNWSGTNWRKPRAGLLIDELAEGVQQVVLYYARAAGESPKYS